MIGSFGGEDDAAKKKAAVVSIVAGFLYGVSWWVFIDAFALNSGDETTKREFHVRCADRPTRT